MFDLSADPLVISEHLRLDPLLAPLARRFPGIRITGLWDPFEAAVRAVVGQQITVAAAVNLVGELVSLCGQRIEGAGDSRIAFLFPTPEQVESADLSSLKMPGARKRTLKALARAWRDVLSDGYREPAELIASLRAIPGVGPWTAAYTVLRGFLEPDAFPSSDVAIRAALGRLEGLDGHASSKDAEARSLRWQPWRGYAALLLWKSLGTTSED